jgi:hypothetical protein
MKDFNEHLRATQGLDPDAQGDSLSPCEVVKLICTGSSQKGKVKRLDKLLNLYIDAADCEAWAPAWRPSNRI